MSKLEKYNQKRNFDKTKEPQGKVIKSDKKLIFCVQHHMSRKEHYDFRLEWQGVLLSWAVPKGPSFNPKDKRLAIMVEDHPLDYANFEGVIPKGQYGGGSVMLWDIGEWQPYGNISEGLEKGTIKFSLTGKRLKGNWALTVFKTAESKNTWLLIKEKDEFASDNFDIKSFNKSISTNRTMQEISDNKQSKLTIAQLNKKLKSFIETDGNNVTVKGVTISSPDKIVFNKPKTKKLDVVLYYAYMYKYMSPYIENRLITSVRCPKGALGDCFYFRNLTEKSADTNNYGLFKKNKKDSSTDGKKEGQNQSNYYFLKNAKAVINEVQLGTLEFHIWGSTVKSINKPDIMIFDLDPDENLKLSVLRQGALHLKSVLDDLGLVSFLKTSGKKGYHIVVPFEKHANWQTFKNFAKNVCKVMEEMWPDRYTANSRKDKRKGKIYVDWVRNIKGSTTVAPYSVRASQGATVSMPITWDNLSRIKPDSITMKKACQMIAGNDAWAGFFDVRQKLTNNAKSK